MPLGSDSAKTIIVVIMSRRLLIMWLRPAVSVYSHTKNKKKLAVHLTRYECSVL